jgi:hypothetical protein
VSDTVPLAVNCVHCGRSVAVQVAGWSAAPYQQATWLCPYLDCQRINGVTMAGRIDRVTADYGYGQNQRGNDG